MIFLSTLSLRRATKDTTARQQINDISIHALLAESDAAYTDTANIPGDFYPRSPCGERRMLAPISDPVTQFLSTLSLRRATAGTVVQLQCILDFYPRSPCGERHDWPPVRDIIQWISIHALLAESDLAGPSGPAFLYNFYPRSPCGERPAQILLLIHHWRFLSTLSLRRATRKKKILSTYRKQFLSTLSLRRATKFPPKKEHNSIFLSTLSLRRATHG